MHEEQIRAMYREILEYDGYFGDPIDTLGFDPWKMVRRDSLTEFERKGVCVSMLCHLATAIDNGTYEDAVAGESATQVRLALRDGLIDDLPLIKQALTAFLQSDAAFCAALENVYREWIIPEAVL